MVVCGVCVGGWVFGGVCGGGCVGAIKKTPQNYVCVPASHTIQ